MSFFIDHDDEWIGVPDFWPFPTPQGSSFDTPELWAAALADELSAVNGLDVPTRNRLFDIMIMAARRGVSAGSRVFVAFEDWAGAGYVVESRTTTRQQLGTQSLESLVGVDDPTSVGAGFVEEFSTASGIEGFRGYRYLPYDDHGVIYGRADYAFECGDEVLTFSGAELDLVFFERLKPALGRLASTTRWSDD